jgi:hypothetical protein
VRKEFALCLPRSGAAIFGGGPFQLIAAPPVDLAADGLRQNQVPFLKYSQNGAYYLRVTGINVNNEPVTLPPGALDLDAGSGEGSVMLSTVAPYTTLRSDIYRALQQSSPSSCATRPPRSASPASATPWPTSTCSSKTAGRG